MFEQPRNISSRCVPEGAIVMNIWTDMSVETEIFSLFHCEIDSLTVSLGTRLNAACEGVSLDRWPKFWDPQDSSRWGLVTLQTWIREPRLISTPPELVLAKIQHETFSLELVLAKIEHEISHAPELVSYSHVEKCNHFSLLCYWVRLTLPTWRHLCFYILVTNSKRKQVYTGDIDTLSKNELK